MHTNIWTSILTPIGIGLMFALFRRFLPVPVAHSPSEPLTDEDRRRYRRWEIGLSLLWLPLGLVLGIAWFLVLTELAGLFPHESPDSVFLVQTPPQFWGIPAVFLGMLSSAIVLGPLARALLRDRYRRFERFCHERVGIDGNRAFIVLAVIILAGSVVLFLAGVTDYARFTEAGVEIGRPLSFQSRSYAYRRIEGIEHRATFRAPAGNIVERPHYVVRFDDGSYWSTREGCRDPDPRVDDPIVRFVSLRSGKAIVARP